MNQERLHTARVRVTESGRLSVTRMTWEIRSEDEGGRGSYIPTDRKWEVDSKNDQELAEAVRAALG